MMLPKRNSATPSTACNAVGDSVLVLLGQRNTWIRKGGRTNGWWWEEWLISESGVMLPLLLLLEEDVDSYQDRSSDTRAESGELDLSLRDPCEGGLEKKSEGSGNRMRKR